MKHEPLVETNSSPMTSIDWWNSFLTKTNNRVNTAVIKDAINEEDRNLLSSEILHVISELCRLRTNKYGYRVYREDELIKGEGLNYIFDNPPFKGEDVEEYASRVFKNENFGMIINGCEKFSDPLSKKLLSLLRPLLDIVGIPMVGLSVHTFVGNYGFTPLGIHKDNPGENVIHFHLGPGAKTMYNWSDEVYKENDGEKKNKEKKYDELIPSAEVYEFEQGDIYFMPWNKFHLGKTDGLSIGVTVWFNNPPKTKLFDRIFSSLTKQYMVDDATNKDILSPVKDPYSQETLKDMQDLLVMDEDFNNLLFKDVLKTLHDDYKIALFSNGGWKTRVISLSDENLFEVKNYNLLKDTVVKKVSPYQIYWRKSIDETKLVIFARGTKLMVKYHTEIESILQKLNDNQEIDSALLLNDLNKEWPEAAGLYILALLYDKRALEIVH